MSRIFVSYRRDDAPDTVGRMVDRLDARFGSETVFRDVDDIDYGANFRDRIRQGLDQTSVMLVVIGPRWLDATDDTGRRLDNEDDPLRIEVGTGLRSNVTVIPVLVRGARMPRRSELPEDLAGLANLNAIEVRRDPDFGNDVGRLISAVEKSAPELVPSTFATGLLKQPSQIAKGGKPRSRRAQLLLVAVAVVALVAGVVAVVALVAGGPRPVPEVVGLEVAAAEDLIRGAGLEVVTNQTASGEVAEGLVISTRPAAATEVEERSEVTLVVSSGPIAVPNVRNRSQARAIDLLRDADLRVEIEREGSNDVSEGLVVRHEPGPGADAGPNDVVTIFVSIGPVVPDVTTVRSDLAQARVAGVVGLDDVNTLRISDESVAEELVIRTEPPAGARAIGSVTLFVSSGPPPPPTVPDVAGKLGVEAEEILEADPYGYVVSVVPTSSPSAAGLVVGTDPEAGESVAKGSAITLLVSSGPAPVVPDLAGAALDEATTVLRESGVTWEVQNEESELVPAQQVIRTEPAGGAVIDRATVVAVIVSSGPPANTPPTAIISGELLGVEGELVVLDASASGDIDGDLVRYEWDFGDGTSGTGVEAPHRFPAAGDYTVTLTVEDDDGSTSVAVAMVTVDPAPVFLGGAFTVQQTFLADLETGTTENVDTVADFWFQAVTADERFITPVNGATMALVGPAGEFPGRAFCESIELSEDAIPVDQLTTGAHVCVMTNEGRPAAFRVETEVGSSPGALSIRFVVWEP